jgi:hypothetical protein
MAMQIAAMSIGIQFYNNCDTWNKSVDKDKFSSNKGYLVWMLVATIVLSILSIALSYGILETSVFDGFKTA